MEKGSSTYSEFNSEMSTVALTDYADKIIISHYFPKPGMVAGTTEMIKKQKKVWEQGNESVAVYSTTGSGAPEYVVVDRLKNGLKELGDNYRKPFGDRYEAMYGEGSWKSWLKDFNTSIESRWSELLFKRKDLSSK